MNETRRLALLSDIMGWDDSEATREFAWLKLMAAIKYDDYRDYLPGMRFFENLAAWLQQFKPGEERAVAYDLLRNRMIYISPAEMQRLVELMYPCAIERQLINTIAARRNIAPYRVRIDPEARADLKKLLRRTLILGLSDGARIDILRHSTVGTLSNEQFVIQTQVDHFKWKSLLKDLREASPEDPKAVFEVVFLVDDFMGTGSSFLRFDTEEQKWTGKLCKFLKSLRHAQEVLDEPLVSDNWQLCVHHYLATQRAKTSVPAAEEAALTESAVDGLTKNSTYTFGEVIDESILISTSKPGDTSLVALTEAYYSRKIETKHTKVGGVDRINLGYGGCSLPLVLHHNTPNNSLPLLWAEADAGDHEGQPQPEMRPLFRRRQRHS